MLDARSIYLYISYVGTRRNKSTPVRVMKEGGTAVKTSRQSCDGSMFHAELIVSKEEGTAVSLRTAGNNMAAHIYIHNIHHTHE